MSDTPRTDAEIYEEDTGYNGAVKVVSPDFARQLERECNELRRELAEARKDKKRLDTLETTDCWIGVYGEYDIKASYYAGGGYSETIRSVADEIIKRNKGT